MRKNSFKAGDLVAVFGGQISKEEKTVDTVTVCRVIFCGLEDLVVENLKGFLYSSAYYAVPKKACQKLYLNSKNLFDSTILKPQIGDLVLSYSKVRMKEEESETITGIIYKIDYKMAVPYKCILICGNEMKEVLYRDLLVLERN